MYFFFFLKQKTAYEMRISDWSSDVCSSDLQNELERLERDGVPTARKILEWRQLAKLKSTYTDALQQQINATTGRVHTSYSLVGAQTEIGRASCRERVCQYV